MSKSYEEILKEQQAKVNKMTYIPLKQRRGEEREEYNTPPIKNTTKKQKWYNEWLKSGAFSDGYQFGDVLKTAFSTTSQIGKALVKGTARVGETAGDLAAYGVAGVADALGFDDYANLTRKYASEDLTGKLFKPLDNVIDKNSVLDTKSDNVISSIGNMYAGSVTGSKLLGKAANIPVKVGGKTLNMPTTSILSGLNSGMGEAYQKGGTNKQALAKGITSGLSEGISEGLFGFMGQGGSDLDDLVVNGLTKNIKNNTFKALTKGALKGVGEGTEEVISYGLNYLGDKAQDKIKNVSGSNAPNMAGNWSWDEVKENFISGSVAGIVGGLPSTIKSIQNKNMRFNNTEGYQENQRLANLPTKEQMTKVNTYLESASKNNIDVNSESVKTIGNVLAKRNVQALWNSNLFKNSKIDAYWTINRNENGYSRSVIINPNADTNKLLENVAMHELYHDMANSQTGIKIKDLILDYDSKKFNTTLNELADEYSKVYDKNSKEFNSLIQEEAVASILGEKIGDQDYLDSLSQNNPAVFDRISAFVTSKLNEINQKVGYKKEKLFWKDVANKVEQAYREDYIDNSDNNSKLSIQQDSNGKKYVNVDTNQNIFENVKSKDYANIAKKYILENFRQNGININQENISVSTRTANEYTHPKTPLPYYVKDSKMKASTELDNLLKVSEYKYSKKDDGRHSFAKDGWDYYKTVFTIGNKTFEGLVNIGKNGNKKTLYDITNLKEVPYISTSDKTFSESVRVPLNDKIITQSNDNVKLPSTKYSTQENENNSKWQEHLNKNYKSNNKGSTLNEVKLPKQINQNSNEQDIKLPIANSENIRENVQNTEDIRLPKPKDKILDPIEISQLTKEAASTTPKLPKINRNQANDGESKYWDNILDKTDMLNVEQKNKILQEDEVKYYDKITNKESLDKAFNRLNDNGAVESTRWFNKESNNADATDVAEGWILLKQYADNNDYDSMVEVAKKMRDIGSKAGQTVQAFNIMERMTPEGMVKYAQSELTEAYNQMIKNKSKEWIDKHRSEFDLKPDEVQFIMNNMKEISTMQDGYDKRIKLAEIQKLMTDKLPPDKGSKIKSWMRISMLFNPKTQVRNVVGNALIMPINNFSDLFSSYADKLISKKTGVRTTGNVNIKAQLKGFKEGAYQATNDYKKGINTKDMEGNRFEIGEGKSFSDKNIIGKNLNKVEGLLNYVMDAGDRMFSQAAFENSLQNQLILNNTTKITQDMIDIARNESLQRTWNDNNNYTKFVLGIRKGINNVAHFGKYGLGDILIPFAKTPANLTKAIVDYSPVGLVNTIIQGNNLKKSLNNGQYTPQMQHKFVQSLGKATAGTMLYILGIALAKAGITSGESDDDKDVTNFLKNTLGVSSYSIKIGNKSFTYDWAQPLAAPLSITANIVNSKNKETALLESVVGNLDTAGSVLLEQSFLTSLNEVLNSNDGVISGLGKQVLDLPARAIPTFSKQIVDLTDSTQRTSYEYGKPLKSAVNSIKAKIPGLSKTLAPVVDTMGREVQRYGGKNNLFNVFLNPANINTENVSESAKEINRLYQELGDKSIMPRAASYYINKNGQKIIMTSEQKAAYQKKTGNIVEKNVKELINNSSYKKMADKEKAEVIKDIVNYSYNIAQKELLGTELSKQYEKAYEYSRIGNINDYYLFKNNIDEDNKKESISNFLINSKLNDKQMAYLYSNYYSSEEELNDLMTMKVPIKEFIKLNSQEFKSDYNTKTGKTISNSSKIKYMQAVNKLNLNVSQKAILIKSKYNSFNQYDNQIVNYIKDLNETINDKKVLLKSIGFDNYDKDVINYIKSQKMSIEEKEKRLKSLGFTIRNGMVYS